MPFTFNLQKIYFNQVKSGDKRIEIRTLKEFKNGVWIDTKFAKTEVGTQYVVWIDSQTWETELDAKEQIIVKVVSINKYDSFEECLMHNLEEAFPDLRAKAMANREDAINEGVDIYRKISDYTEREKYGVIAFDIEIVNEN